MTGGLREPTRRRVLASAAGLGLGGLIGLPGQRLPQLRPALTSLQLAGQRVISSYSGLTPPQSLFNDITAGHTAGVIFYGQNISSEAQIAGVITQLRQAQASCRTADGLRATSISGRSGSR